MKSNKRTFFVGLRWKLLLPLFIFVLFTHTALYSYVSQQLQRQYQMAQQELFKGNLRTLDGALTSSYHKLLEVGQTILLMTQPASDLSSHQYVQSSIADKFSQFEAQGILDGAAVFDADGELMLSLGNIDVRSKSAVQSVLKNEYPVREISCENQCVRSIAIPLLNAGELEGVLVLGRLMQDMILEFKQLTAVEMGIARKSIKLPSDIAAWSLDFTQLTQRNRNLQILQALSYRIPEPSNDTSYQVDVFDSKHEVFFTVPESIESTNTVWVLIADVTARFQALNELKAQLGFGLLISGCFLLIVAYITVLKTTRRLGAVCLSKSTEYYSPITDQKQACVLYDEIDLITQLINELESKHASLVESGQIASLRLAEMAKALSIEKEIVAHLVGNSENVIVTQSLDGTVLTVNDVGKKLFGISGKIDSEVFTDLFFAGESNQEAIDSINRLYLGLDNLVCSNSQSLDLHGQLRDFTWIHSFIDECSMHRSVILSIGMDVTMKRRAEKRLAWLALHVPLGEVESKQFFLEKLPALMEESLKSERPLAVLCCDVKQLRDSHLLRDISENDTALFAAVVDRISSCLRDDDIIARFGDELFMVILKGLKTHGNGGDVAQKIIQAFENPFLIDAVESIIDINIGISVFPGQVAGVAEIVSNAEVAMSLSKELGVNNYQYYSHEKAPSESSYRAAYVD